MRWMLVLALGCVPRVDCPPEDVQVTCARTDCTAAAERTVRDHVREFQRWVAAPVCVRSIVIDPRFDETQLDRYGLRSVNTIRLTAASDRSHAMHQLCHHVDRGFSDDAELLTHARFESTVDAERWPDYPSPALERGESFAAVCAAGPDRWGPLDALHVEVCGGERWQHPLVQRLDQEVFGTSMTPRQARLVLGEPVVVDPVIQTENPQYLSIAGGNQDGWMFRFGDYLFWSGPVRWVHQLGRDQFLYQLHGGEQSLLMLIQNGYAYDSPDAPREGDLQLAIFRPTDGSLHHLETPEDYAWTSAWSVPEGFVAVASTPQGRVHVLLDPEGRTVDVSADERVVEVAGDHRLEWSLQWMERASLLEERLRANPYRRSDPLRGARVTGAGRVWNTLGAVWMHRLGDTLWSLHERPDGGRVLNLHDSNDDWVVVEPCHVGGELHVRMGTLYLRSNTEDGITMTPVGWEPL